MESGFVGVKNSFSIKQAATVFQVKPIKNSLTVFKTLYQQLFFGFCV